MLHPQIAKRLCFSGYLSVSIV